MTDFLGLFTLVNTIWAVSVAMIASAFTWIFILYILPLFIGMPIGFLELLAYFLDGALFYAAHYFATVSPHTFSPIFLALLACLGVPLLYAFTVVVHFENVNAEYFFKIGIWLSAIVWSAAAIYFSSQLIAMIAVAAFFTALGFIFVSLPFCYILGFSSKSAIPRSMNVAFYCIAVYIYVTIQNLDENPLWNVFRPAILGLGTFVFFLGGLIVSNRLYHGPLSFSDNLLHYLWTNFFVCVCGVLAIAFGGVFSKLSLLKSVGGTFFCLFLLEKYLEFPWNQGGYISMMFGLGVILYLLSWSISQHPEYILSLQNFNS